MARLWLLDVGAIGAWKHFGVSESSPHADMVEGVRQWWDELEARYQPTLAVACLDCSRESNWRKKLFVEYKSGRDSKPKDEALSEGMRKLPALFAGLGVPTLRADGFEADDLIATLSAQHDDEAIVVTSDKDLMQLVDERVKVYDPRPNRANECVFYDAEKVLAKHHVPPHRLREFLAIDGDASDSIPGVSGWGKVAAVTAINQTRSRMELLRLVKEAKLRDIAEKKQLAFAEQIAEFELSYELVGLRFDAPIPDDFDCAVNRASEAA